MGRLRGFYADRFLIPGVQQIKVHSFSKIKKRVKYTMIRVLQAKAFGNISFYDRCRPVHSAREVIKIKLALFMAQSIPSVPILPPALFVGHLSFCFGKASNAPQWGFLYPILKNRVQMPHPGTTPKFHFPVNKLQIPMQIYRKSVII